jgi:hypothetical protein
MASIETTFGVLVGLRLIDLQSMTPRKKQDIDVCLTTKPFSEGECCICMESENSARVRDCGHEFCSNCIVMTIRKNGKKCPMCREDIRMIEIDNAAEACLRIYNKMTADAGL